MLDVSRSGFQLDGAPIDTTALRDSLQPFCAEKVNRRMWKLTASDTSLKSQDFVRFLSFISSINQDCRGLFGLGETDPPVMMQPPVPAPRSVYNLSIHQNDSLRPRASLMVVAERHRIRMYSQEGWMPEIPVATDINGMDWVATDSLGQVRTGWHDIHGRCAVDVRRDQCADSLWANSKYVLLGNLMLPPDTIRTDKPKDMDMVVRGPLKRDIAVAASVHALRTIGGTIVDDRAYNHGVLGPDLTWESTIRLIIALRMVGIDFNTVEIYK